MLSRLFREEHSLPRGAVLHIHVQTRGNACGGPRSSAFCTVRVGDGKDRRRVCSDLLLPPHGGTSPAVGLGGVMESFFRLLCVFESFHNKLLRGKQNKRKPSRILFKGSFTWYFSAPASTPTSTQKCLVSPVPAGFITGMFVGHTSA